jgi:hypothetical protein
MTPGPAPISSVSDGHRTEGSKSLGKHQARVLHWLTAHEVKLANRLPGPGTAAENLPASRAK